MTLSVIAFALGMAASLGISLTTMVLALRSPGLSYRPVWAVLALVGAGGGALVLARPEQVYWFFGIALPTASFRGLDASLQPHTLQLLFPVGALLVLLRLYRHRSRWQEVGDGTS